MPATPEVAPAVPQPQSALPQAQPPQAQTVAIPMLRGTASIAFGRIDSDYHVATRIVDIANLTAVATATYHQLQQLSSIDFPLNVDEFVQVCQTLYLKRVQDVMEKENLVRPAHFVRMTRNIMVPAPIADLLYSLGNFHSKANGVRYVISQPDHPAQPPAWWQLDADDVPLWNQVIGRVQHAYVMREFPSPTDYANHPLILTNVQTANNLRSVKSLTNEAQMSDGFLAFVNGPIFNQVAPNDYAGSHLRIVESLYVPTVLSEYVRGYVTNATSI